MAGSLLASLPLRAMSAEPGKTAPPHIFLSMTDDQADEPLSLMRNWRERIAEVGIQFANCYVPLSECEPSRATFQTGQTAHNHKARGYATFRPGEDNTLPVWLQQAGYFTAFVGKYFTDFGQENQPLDHVPPGWDWFSAACDPSGPFRYRGPQCNENGKIVRYSSKRYITDVQTDQALAAMEAAKAAGKPLFLMVCWLACHGNDFMGFDNAPEPRADNFGWFNGVPYPHRPSWGEADMTDKPPWMQGLALPDLAVTDFAYQRRLECLATTPDGRGGTVDDGLGRILDRFDDWGWRRNAYVGATSDNAEAFGEHRWIGKAHAYLENAKVRFDLAGPKIPRTGQVLGELVQTTDIVATICALAGAEPGRVLDGRSLRPLFAGRRVKGWRTAVLAETSNFKAIRTADFHLIVTDDELGHWEELYDYSRDPWEMEGALAADPAYATILAQLKDCLYGTNDTGVNRRKTALATGAGPRMWCDARFDPPPG